MPGWELGVICGSVIVAVLLAGLLLWWLTSRSRQGQTRPEEPGPNEPRGYTSVDSLGRIVGRGSLDLLSGPEPDLERPSRPTAPY